MSTTTLQTEPHSNTEVNDIELVSMPSVTSREAGERDPLLLRDRIIGADQLKQIRQRKAGGKVADFYQTQNDRIDGLLKPLSTHSAEAEQDSKDSALKVKIAINLSFAMNVVLAGVQLYAAISSGSLALFASCVDAVDPFANLILWFAHRRSAKAKEAKWPVRGSRFETSTLPEDGAGITASMLMPIIHGNIVYGSIMGGVNVILIVMSIQEFVDHSGDELNTLHLPSIISVCVAFGVKFALFLYCSAIRKSSSQVQVLWEDHRNDLFTNAFGILTSAGGSKLKWWIDPLGATVLACVIIIIWTRTVYEQFTFLAGITAPPEFINLVTYKAMTFSPSITSIDTVRAYHSGPQYFVEIDIVLPPNMPLWEAHDIAQDLQDQIERLKDVDRCFVHVDHEISHEPEHRKKV